jgi:copine 1/2/3
MDASQMVTKVQLYIKCTNLIDKDVTSKSDPTAFLYEITNGGKRLIGRTETIKDNLNPVFKTAINVDYRFEVSQQMMVVITDVDGTNLQGDPLGELQFELAQVMGKRGCTLTSKLQKVPRGEVTLTAVEMSNNNDTLVFFFEGMGLAKMDTFGKSDPYFKLFRVLPDGTNRELLESDMIKNTLDPKWKGVKVNVNQACSGNLTASCLFFHCWDYDAVGQHDIIGGFTCSLQDLISAAGQGKEFELVKKEKPGKKYGRIKVAKMEVIHNPSFVEFLQGGMQINLAVSIDFTGSNGDPRTPQSLHFLSPDRPNQYMHAITSVGTVLAPYDYDQQFPAFGFGAVLPGGQVSHFFHLNMSPNPYVTGVQGVMEAYFACLPRIKLYGPTNFAPTIASATAGARAAKGVYTVLLIITDGDITDMDQTVDELVKADDAPISIVIVGVGSGCDFAAMSALDCDGAALRSGGRISRRDLVQFVPFRTFVTNPTALAGEVLKEVPAQVVKWAALAGVKPGFQ